MQILDEIKQLPKLNNAYYVGTGNATQFVQRIRERCHHHPILPSFIQQLRGPGSHLQQGELRASF